MSLVRSADRFVTRLPGIVTRHAFSFGRHYDPANIRFGPVLAFNDERLEPAAAYAPHRHAGILIVTHVVTGVLDHGGPPPATLRAGQSARTDASGGIEHWERNASATEQLRFLQTFLDPAGPAGEPVVVLLMAGEQMLLPDKDFVHVFVIEGAGECDGVGPLADGDSVRIRSGGRPAVTTSSRLLLQVWAF